MPGDVVYMLTNHLAPATHRLQLEAMEARKKNGGSRGIGFTSNCTRAIHMDTQCILLYIFLCTMRKVRNPPNSLSFSDWYWMLHHLIVYHITTVFLSLWPAMDYRYQILLHSTRPLSNQLRVGIELLGGSFPPPWLNFPGITASSRQYWCDMEVACEGQTRTATAICETDIASKSASLWFPIHNHRPVFPVMALPMALLQEQPTTVTTRIRFCN